MRASDSGINFTAGYFRLAFSSRRRIRRFGDFSLSFSLNVINNLCDKLRDSFQELFPPTDGVETNTSLGGDYGSASRPQPTNVGVGHGTFYYYLI